GENDVFDSGRRIAMRLQALRADFFHHALHRRIDRRDRPVAGLEMRRENAFARLRHRRHHAIGADGDDAVDILQRDGRQAELALSVRMDAFDNIADEGEVLWTFGTETGRLVAAPDNGVGRQFDFVPLVAIAGALVAGEINDTAAARPKRLPDR